MGWNLLQWCLQLLVAEQLLALSGDGWSWCHGPCPLALKDKLQTPLEVAADENPAVREGDLSINTKLCAGGVPEEAQAGTEMETAQLFW